MPTCTPALPFCHVTLRGQRPLPAAYPQTLRTLGDHLRKRRLDLCLLQREAAERIGVDPTTVTNWELSRTAPALRFIPSIIRFLGYVPFPPGQSLADRLRAARRTLGLSQERVAAMLDVDESTVTRWERGCRRPGAALLERVEAILTA